MKAHAWFGLVGLLGIAALGAGGCGENNSANSDGGTDGGVGGGLRGQGDATGGIGDGGTGTGADTSLGTPVPGAEPLTITHRTAYRRITNFQRGMDAKFISEARLSGDGSTVAFAAAQGTFTIATDGTKLVQLSDKPNTFGFVDISADGKKVAWLDNLPDHYEIFVANSDGSGKVRLPGTHGIKGIRITAAGDQVFEMAPDLGGIVKFPADGGAMTLVLATATVATLNGVDPNANHWRNVLDISNDGSKIVFSFLWDAFSCAGDGSGLKQLTHFLMPENRTLRLVRISGNGAKVAWNVDDSERSTVTIADWGGGNPVVYTSKNYREAYFMDLAGDGSKLALGYGLRTFDTSKVAPYDAGDYGSNPIPLNKMQMDTLSADGKRACLVIEGPESTDQGLPHQIVIVDFDPANLAGLPTIEGTSALPRFATTSDMKLASLFAVVKDAAGLTAVTTIPQRDGWHLGLLQNMTWPLNDEAMRGDTAAMDGTFSTNNVRLGTDDMVAPGPFTLRFIASNKANNVLMVDTEGMEARAP